MQKIINGIAIFSGVVALGVVGLGGYVFIRKDAIIDSVKEKAMNKLSIGSDFPKISLETTEGKSLIIPQDIKTRYCILLFIRGAW